MKYLLALILATTLTAAVSLEMIYPNPYTEAGSEFVLLANYENSSIDITNWVVETPASQTDVTISGTIPAQSTFLVTDTGWNESKDDPTWPPSNYEEVMSLANTNGYVILKDDTGNNIDSLHYGEGTTIENPPEGFALTRQENNTWQVTEVTFENNNEQEIVVTVDVENTPPRIFAVQIEDDDPTQEGWQILPPVTNSREIQVSAIIEDNNTLLHTTILVNNQSVNHTTNATRQNITTSIPITKETTQITIVAEDEDATILHTEEIQLLPVTALSFPENIVIDAKPGENSTTDVELTNIGTTNIQLHIKGKTPTRATTVLGDMSYTLFGLQYHVEEQFRSHQTILEPNESITLQLEIQAGWIPAGNYAGQLIIAGVAN